jgi:two-component system sensor histidine kinase HydH
VNAVEAMPEGGTLSVEVQRAEGVAEEQVEVVVSDTGKGIRAEDLRKIFEPFHTTKADGTGLGLAIVQRVVEAHAGDVTVTSEEGRGSSFRLRFPVSSNERESIPTAR